MPQDDSVSALLRTAQKHADANQLDAAAECLERVLALAPAHIGALEGLAEISLQQGKHGAARAFALRAMKTASTDSNALLLARIARAMGNLEEALKCYEAIIKAAPQHLPSIIGVAEIYEEAGYHARATAQYEVALAAAPHDFEILNRLAKLYRFADTPRLVDLYARVRPPESAPAAVKLAFQYQFVKRKEMAERARRNLPSHVLAPDDLFFRFAQDELNILESMADASLAGDTPDPNALVCKGTCLLARGRRVEVEKFFHMHAAQHEDRIYETMMFNDDFYRRLETVDQATLLEGLPALSDVSRQSFTDGAVIFLSCDINYFLLFTRPLLASMNDVAPGSQAHVHIMNATDAQLQAAKAFCAGLTKSKIALSAEDASRLTPDTETAKHYFHAIRFARMLQYLEIYQRPLWLMDVDALLNRDPRSVLESAEPADVVLYGHAARFEPWCQFNASIVGIMPSAQGLSYLRLVAAYIMHFYRRNQLWWGIDQFALYGVFEFLKNTPAGLAIRMVPSNTLDGDYTPEGIIWGNGSGAKFRQSRALSSLPHEQPDAPRLRYLAALEKYTSVNG